MSEKIYPPTAEFSANAHVNADRYAAMYAESIRNPEGFWTEQAKCFDWIMPFT